MVYLPTFTMNNQLNVGEYAIHGWYGPFFMGILATPPKKQGLIKGLLTIGFP